jgi:hypothetical protein
MAPIWECVKDHPGEAYKAQVKAKVLTGTYRLQALRARFNQHEVDPTCPLCGKEPEDRAHFLLRCPTLEAARTPHMESFHEAMEEITGGAVNLASDHTVLLHALLDVTHPKVPQAVREGKGAIERLERVSRNLIYILHRERWLHINSKQSDITGPLSSRGAPTRR